MPPAAAGPHDGYESISMMNCCGAFDMAEIEVVNSNDASNTKDRSTRIVIFPGQKNINNHSVTLNDEDASTSRYDYLTNIDRTASGRSLADSFDSTDEIIDGSNEMKLMKRVVEKQRDNIYGRGQGGQQQGIDRQDSMSDTNSVNANDVFMSVEDSKEIEYLDVLDKTLDYSDLEDEPQDFHPNKQQYQEKLDDIIDHLCAAPCGECAISNVDPMNDRKKLNGYPKSVLRRPRYSSSSLYRSNGRYDGQSSIVLASSSSSRSVRFQNVDIRNFKMTLGNHPSATTGPPVMLDGELAEPRHLARKVIPLEKYEKTRPPRRKRRQMKLTLQQRHNILVKERGFSFEEVKGAWQEALDIRRQRKETLERGLALMKWDEVWESTCRKFNRLVDSTTI